MRRWMICLLCAIVTMPVCAEELAEDGPRQAAPEAITDPLPKVPLQPIQPSPAVDTSAPAVPPSATPNLGTPPPAFQPGSPSSTTVPPDVEHPAEEADDLGVWGLKVAMGLVCATVLLFLFIADRRRIARWPLYGQDGFMSESFDEAFHPQEQPTAVAPPTTPSSDYERGGVGLPRGTSASPLVGMPVQPQPVEATAATGVGATDVATPVHAEAPATSPSTPAPAVAPGDCAQPQAAPAVGAGLCTVDAIREARAAHSHQSWRSFNRDALPQLLFYGGNKFCQFSTDRMEAADEWFIIGDIHGDFYALHAIVSYIRKTCPGFGIVFLGDLIDRGPHPIECLWYLLKLADDHPNRVLWLAGNHDVGVRFDAQMGMFRSTVEPAEFVSDLNVVDSFAPLRRSFGLEYIELSHGLPRAAVMPDGLLLTHGGFPHTDLQPEFAGMTLNTDRRRWLESEPVIRDFTHLRITRYPTRRPNRLSISCSYGYKDFEAFCQAMNAYNVKRLVTGHQHAEGGYDDHPDWAKSGNEALTLTGFGFADAYDRPESYAANYRRHLVTARCRPDQLPELISIAVDQADLRKFFDEEIVKMPRFAAT